MSRVFFSSLLSHNFDDQLSSNFYRFVILCTCWDTPSEKTGLWQLPLVPSVFNNKAHIKQSSTTQSCCKPEWGYHVLMRSRVWIWVPLLAQTIVSLSKILDNCCLCHDRERKGSFTRDRSFASAAPCIWNSLPLWISDLVFVPQKSNLFSTLIISCHRFSRTNFVVSVFYRFGFGFTAPWWAPTGVRTYHRRIASL